MASRPVVPIVVTPGSTPPPASAIQPAQQPIGSHVCKNPMRPPAPLGKITVVMFRVERSGEISGRAVEWYRATARAGSDKAGANLGWGSGEGVERDLVLSYMWYSIALTASAGGNATAQQSLDHLGKMISDSDIAKAKQPAESCRKSGFAECGG